MLILIKKFNQVSLYSRYYAEAFNERRSSDGQVVRASACGAVDAGFIPSRVKPLTLNLVFTASLH